MMRTPLINEEQEDAPIDDVKHGTPTTKPFNHEGPEYSSSVEQSNQIPEFTMAEIQYTIDKLKKKKGNGRERNRSITPQRA